MHPNARPRPTTKLNQPSFSYLLPTNTTQATTIGNCFSNNDLAKVALIFRKGDASVHRPRRQWTALDRQAVHHWRRTGMKRGRSASNELVRFGTTNVNRQQRQLVCVVACTTPCLTLDVTPLPEMEGREVQVVTAGNWTPGVE